VYVYTHKLIDGTARDLFSPHAQMTRGMIATVLWRLAGEPDAGEYSFADVSSGAYYAKAMNWARENGILGGFGGGFFAPDVPVTREQLAAILLRYINYSSYEYTVTEEYRLFADEAQIADYAKNAVQVLNKLGILGGRGDGVIDPRGQATRAEVAAMMHRLLDR
jgi:hypothetical protein